VSTAAADGTLPDAGLPDGTLPDGVVLIDSATGPVRSDQLGLTLSHEHLANSIAVGGVEADPHYPELFDRPVTASDAWLLRERPYSSLDNTVLDNDAAMLDELLAFRAIGGSTVVEVTSFGQGRSPARVKALAEKSGVTIIMGGGFYLERFHPSGSDAWSVDEMAGQLLRRYRPQGAEDGVIPGLIGEIGVSPAFTDREANSLRAACLVQLEVHKPLMIHLPGWLRRGHEVLDIVLDEFGVDPRAVVLAHMDPSGTDPDYQASIADRGVWTEFDMIGMPHLFPGEGQAPSPPESAAAIARLVERGNADQILMSHDLFLKSMMRTNGGNGLLYVPTLFGDRLRDAGVDGAIVAGLLTANPRALFEAAAL